MTAVVVPLGQISAPTGASVSEVVEILRDLLESAEKGEIRAIAIASVDGGNSCSANWCVGTVLPSTLVASATRMSHKIVDAWDDK